MFGQYKGFTSVCWYDWMVVTGKIKRVSVHPHILRRFLPLCHCHLFVWVCGIANSHRHMCVVLVRFFCLSKAFITFSYWSIFDSWECKERRKKEWEKHSQRLPSRSPDKKLVLLLLVTTIFYSRTLLPCQCILLFFDSSWWLLGTKKWCFISTRLNDCHAVPVSSSHYDALLYFLARLG